jgi:hypothetical protein
MSRLFWLGLGAAVGVYLTRRASRAARHLTPGGFAEDLGDALRELAGAVGSFGADVRAGMAERERDLHRMVHERTGIPIAGATAATSATSATAALSATSATTVRARGAAD